MCRVELSHRPSSPSASFGGLEEWEKAAEDAKECIRLNPEFIKGYYRLAAAQMGSHDYEAALATIRQGLGVENNNAQLLKQMRTVKQAQRIAETKQNTTSNTLGASYMDEASRKELQDLQQQYTQTNRELQTIQATLSKIQRESKSSELTRKELIPLLPETKCYRSVGKMFLLSSRDGVIDFLDEHMATCSKQESDMNQKVEYLQRRLRSQKQNIEELVGASRSA